MNYSTKIRLCCIHQSAITTHKGNHVYSLLEKVQVEIVVIYSPRWFVNSNNLSRGWVANSKNLCKRV